NAAGEIGGYPPMRDHVVSRKASRLPRAFEMDLRGQQRSRVAHRDEKFRMREPLEDFRNVIAIGRRLFDPAFYALERDAKNFRVRFDHQNEQIAARIRRIKSGSFKCLEKSLV